MKLNKWQNYETLAKIIVRGEKDILQSKKKKNGKRIHRARENIMLLFEPLTMTLSCATSPSTA